MGHVKILRVQDWSNTFRTHTRTRGVWQFYLETAYQVITAVDGSEILHQLVDWLFHYLQGFYTSQVVQDFFHQHINSITTAQC